MELKAKVINRNPQFANWKAPRAVTPGRVHRICDGWLLSLQACIHKAWAKGLTRIELAARAVRDRHRLSARGKRTIELSGVSKLQWGAFMPGVPDVTEFPLKSWNRLQSRIWRKPQPELMTYAPGGGYRLAKGAHETVVAEIVLAVALMVVLAQIKQMTGNVAEFVQDNYGAWSAESVTDPVGPASSAHRVYRGCSYADVAESCRIAARHIVRPNQAPESGTVGFRLVRLAP